MNTAHRERRARRISVQYPIYYSNGTFQTIGVTEDFNSSGGRIRGKEQVSVGMELVVIVIQPTPDIPMLVRRGTVRWSKGQDFGIALSDVPPQSESELKAMAKVMLPGLWSCLN
ncbi:MAG: PilZ domain-containing protein [Nitrospira sp.]|nr:PilZ domain-containing protein [Nitrospira sp.]